MLTHWKDTTLLTTASSLALLDRCTFDDVTICGMMQIAADDANWHWVSGTTEVIFTSEIDGEFRPVIILSFFYFFNGHQYPTFLVGSAKDSLDRT